MMIEGFSLLLLFSLSFSLGFSTWQNEVDFWKSVAKDFPTGTPKANAVPLTASDLDELIERTRQCSNIPGLSMAIFSHNPNAPTPLARNLTYAEAFGKKDVEQNVEADNETLFCIGSLTKHFTATLLLKMLRMSRDQGYHYNETSLARDFDPSLEFQGSNLREVTIEDILSHQTGIAETFGPLFVGYDLNMSRADLAQIAAKCQRLRPNRDVFHYNNHVFSTAGYITEIVGEKLKNSTVTWESLMREYLLQPLGISKSVEFCDKANYSQMAIPYFSVKGVLRAADYRILETIYPAGAAGAVCMSASAMIPWMQFLLNKGSFEGKQIVESEDIENTWRPRLSSYGLGWGSSSYRGHNLVTHSGYLPPYTSSILVFHELNMSLYTSINVPSPINLQTLQLNIFDQLMGYDPPYPIACNNGSQVTTDSPTNSTPLTLDVEQYVGVYRHPYFGQLDITSSDGQLHAQLGRYGNASIHCVNSVTKCKFAIDGILWYLAEADAFQVGNESMAMIDFWKVDGEHVHTISLPWYSGDILVEFYWQTEPPKSDICVSTSYSTPLILPTDPSKSDICRSSILLMCSLALIAALL